MKSRELPSQNEPLEPDWQTLEMQSGWNQVSQEEIDREPIVIQDVVEHPIYVRNEQIRAGSVEITLKRYAQFTATAVLDRQDEHIGFLPAKAIGTQKHVFPHISVATAEREFALSYTQGPKIPSVKRRYPEATTKVYPVPEKGNPQYQVNKPAASFKSSVEGKRIEEAIRAKNTRRSGTVYTKKAA